jgi:ABC-type glycerol-3-phosphate transport system substrate-binding protein
VPISVVEGRWHALPDFYIVAPLIWRKDLFDQQGLAAPDTWELARVAARTLKPKGHPTGIAFSHCNDANLFLRAIVFSHGGQEADPSGQNILIDSKETREGLRFLKALYEDGMTPEVFSWDDASDNRYLASGVACWIHDAISAYRSTEDTNPRVFQNTHLALEPQGLPSKRVSIANPNAYAMWKFAKNVPAAKEFLIHLADNWKDSMIGSRGYNMPFLKDAYRKPMPVIGSDPKLQILQDFPDIVAFAGQARSRPRFRNWSPPSCSPTCARAWSRDRARTRPSSGRWESTGGCTRGTNGAEVALLIATARVRHARGCAAGHQKIANGCAGAPVLPTRRIGVAVNKNS